MVITDEEYEGLTTGRSSFMCFPMSFAAICCSSSDANSFTFSKVILTPEEKLQYQVPWEKQQKKQVTLRKKPLCLCWCCYCSCLCKPVNNRKNRRVSNTKLEHRADCYKTLIEATRYNHGKCSGEANTKFCHEQRPTVDQVHKWSSSFDDVMKDETALLLFEIFLQQEHSDENIKFWSAVEKLKHMSNEKDKKTQMKKIYNDFLKPMAPKEINISGHTRRKIEEDLMNDANDDVFDAAQNQVFLLMHRQSYPRFLTSDLFHAVVQGSYAYNVAMAVK